MIKFRCKGCQHKIAVPNDYEGKHVKCPSCGKATLVRNDPPEIRITDTGKSRTASPAAAGAARAGKPASAAARVRQPVSGTQADALVAAMDEPGSTTGLPDHMIDEIESELAAEQAQAARSNDSQASIPPHHVPHAHPPHYLFLQALGFTFLALGGLMFALWLAILVAVLVGADTTAALPPMPKPLLILSSLPFLLPILWTLAAGQALLALRDIARNSAYHRESTALLRQLQQHGD